MAGIESVPAISNLISILRLIVLFFNEFYDRLTSNLWELLSDAYLPDWLFNLLTSANIDVFLSQFTLIGLMFSLVVVYIIVVKFFVPVFS